MANAEAATTAQATVLRMAMMLLVVPSHPNFRLYLLGTSDVYERRTELLCALPVVEKRPCGSLMDAESKLSLHKFYCPERSLKPVLAWLPSHVV